MSKTSWITEFLKEFVIEEKLKDKDGKELIVGRRVNDRIAIKMYTRFIKKVETDAVRGVLEKMEETFCKSKVIKGDKYYITGSWTAWAIGDAISKLKSNLKEEDK